MKPSNLPLHLGIVASSCVFLTGCVFSIGGGGTTRTVEKTVICSTQLVPQSAKLIAKSKGIQLDAEIEGDGQMYLLDCQQSTVVVIKSVKGKTPVTSVDFTDGVHPRPLRIGSNTYVPSLSNDLELYFVPDTHQ